VFERRKRCFCPRENEDALDLVSTGALQMFAERAWFLGGGGKKKYLGLPDDAAKRKRVCNSPIRPLGKKKNHLTRFSRKEKKRAVHSSSGHAGGEGKKRWKGTSEVR